jgi:hypothetical protein
MHQFKPIQRQTNLIIKKRLRQLIPLQIEKSCWFDQKTEKHLESEFRGLYILLIASQFKQTCFKTKWSRIKCFPKSILNRLIANNITPSLIGSGITLLVSDSISPLLFQKEGVINGLKHDEKKIWMSHHLSSHLHLPIKEKIGQKIDHSLVDQCLGALVIKPNQKILFIEPSELRQSFQTSQQEYVSNTSTIQPPLTLAHISLKLKYPTFESYRISKQPMIKLLSIVQSRLNRDNV